jgi:hypothetical protein
MMRRAVDIARDDERSGVGPKAVRVPHGRVPASERGADLLAVDAALQMLAREDPPRPRSEFASWQSRSKRPRRRWGCRPARFTRLGVRAGRWHRALGSVRDL